MPLSIWNSDSNSGTVIKKTTIYTEIEAPMEYGDILVTNP